MICPAMKYRPVTDEEPDLHQLLEDDQRLLERQEQVEKSRRQVATAMNEAAHTLPPSELVLSRGVQKEYEGRVTRTQDRNARREQGRSILLLLSLIAALVSLVWWAARLAYGK